MALKVLTGDFEMDRKSFAREAALLLKIRHPAVASVLGFDVASDQMFPEDRGPCFWMEYVEGRPILSMARFSPPGRVMDWLRQILEALRDLHAQNIFHNDLSPANLLITGEGRVKILDFGLATAFGADAELKAGTLPYLPPERLAGKVSPAGDIFSLGTIIYEALAGSHPRSGAKNLQDLMRLKPLPLGERVPALEFEYAREARSIDRMVETDLDRRFARVSDVLAAWRTGESAAKAVPFHSAVFYGADAKVKSFGEGASAPGVRSRLVAVHGPSGTGRRRFFQEAGLALAAAGVSVEEIPAAGRTKRLLELADAPPREPTAFLIPHAEQATPQDRNALMGLRRSVPERPGGAIFLISWNDDRLDGENRRFFENFIRFPEIEEIALGNLSAEQAADMVEAGLGTTARREIADVLHESCGGNPRMLVEWINWLREKGAAGKKYFARGEIENIRRLHAPGDLAVHRLESLSAGETEVLAALASAGRPVPEEEFLSCLHGVLQEPAPALVALFRRDLIRKESGTYRLAAGELAPALKNKLSREKWEEWQRRWFAALADRPESHPAKLRHALALADFDWIRKAALPVLEALQNEQRCAEALGFAEDILARTEDPVLRSRVLRLQCNLFQELRRFEDALAAAEASYALQAADEPPEIKKVKYFLVTGLLHQHAGRFSEAESRFRQCADLAAQDPAGTLLPFWVRATALLGVEAARAGRKAEAKSLLKQAWEASGASGRRRAEIARNLAIAASEEGARDESASWFAESLRLYREERDEAGEVSTLLEIGNHAVGEDRPEAAEAAYREAETLAKRRGDELALALIWNNLGVLARKRLLLDAALEYFGKASDVFRALGHPRDLAEHLTQYAFAETAAGRFDRAAARIGDLAGLAATVPEAARWRHDAESFLAELKEGACEPLPAVLRGNGDWNWEGKLRRFARIADAGARALLDRAHAGLSVGLQVTFADRFDFRKPKHVSSPKEGANMNILESLSAVSRDLLRETDMEKVLSRLMDAVLALSRAENGFLLLKREGDAGPIPGFSVVVARNLKKEDLARAEFAVSLSAIRQAMETGEPAVTDNALTDPRFSQAKSVRLHELKSILALPLNGPEGILGVFYLDHRFELGLFSEELLAGLKAFADQAALALQKAEMIDGLEKSNRNLSHRVEEQDEQLHQMERELSQNRLKLKHEYSEIVGRSPKMVQVLGMVDKITDSRIPVWIFGESGTGKESIARALHFNSARSKHPFVSENCSALPETLMESELFGHKRGAFTHADRDKKGILQYADKGTIFLDEVADMSLNLQAKLLRFLQEGEIRPLGSNEIVKVDVRVVSASNKDLADLVEEGKFREDLFFRLNAITVNLPPLRERREDIPILVDHFLKRAAAREKQKAPKVHADALRTFLDYSWPGNIRELQNTLETALLFAENGVISAKSLQFKPALFSRRKPAKGQEPVTAAREGMDAELEGMLEALRDQGFHKGNAARALGISRRNLYSKLEKHGVPLELQDLMKYIEEKLI